MNLKIKLDTKKKKIIAIITAVVSVILCATILLLTVSSCSEGDSNGKTVVKKVIKKKVIVVKDPEDDGVDDDENTYYDGVDNDGADNDGADNDKNTYYDVVDDDYDGPEEVVDTVVVPQYEVELEGKVKTPMSDKIAFGFWSYRPGEWTEQFGEKYGKEADIFTTCDIYNIEEAKWCEKNGTSGWIKTMGGFVDDTAELSPSWMETMISTAEAYKAMGLWDVIEGFHFDEPLLKLTGEQFRAMTKFLAETFPDKRIYPVCCPYEVDGYGPTKTFDAISYYNCGYITDIGLDWYGEPDIKLQRNMLNKMKEQVGRKDVRIWLFPTTFRQFSSTDEDYMIKHLNMYYDLLMEQENPGGLHLFSWYTYDTMTGFSQLTDPAFGWNYNRLLDRVLEIGKEIKNTKYTYKTTKN